MSSAKSRLSKLASHFLPSSSPFQSDPSNDEFNHRYHIHSLSPTYFLPRAATVEPDVSSQSSLSLRQWWFRPANRTLKAEAIYHVTANNKVLRRSYIEAADRARGFAYYVKKHGYKKVGILCPNTPAFLESIFGIGAAGAVNVGMRANTGALLLSGID